MSMIRCDAQEEGFEVEGAVFYAKMGEFSGEATEYAKEKYEEWHSEQETKKENHKECLR